MQRIFCKVHVANHNCCYLVALVSMATGDINSYEPLPVASEVETANVSPTSVSCGVNRRTMILFSKKAKQRRLSAIQLAAGKDSIVQTLMPENGDLTTEIKDFCDTVEIQQPDFLVAETKLEPLEVSVNGALLRPPAKRKRVGRPRHQDLSDVSVVENVASSDKVELVKTKLRARQLTVFDDQMNIERLINGGTDISKEGLESVADDKDFQRARGTSSP